MQAADPEVIRQARDLYAELGSFSEVAKALNLNNTTVRQWALAKKPDGEPWQRYRARRYGTPRHGGMRL